MTVSYADYAGKVSGIPTAASAAGACMELVYTVFVLRFEAKLIAAVNLMFPDSSHSGFLTNSL